MGDTPSPSTAARARGAPYKQVMIVFLELQRESVNYNVILTKGTQSMLSTSLFQARVFLQVTESMPSPSLSAVSQGHSPLLLSTSHRDAAGPLLCCACVTAPSTAITGQDHLTEASAEESHTRGFATHARYKHSLIILHSRSSSGNPGTALREP